LSNLIFIYLKGIKVMIPAEERKIKVLKNWKRNNCSGRKSENKRDRG